MFGLKPTGTYVPEHVAGIFQRIGIFFKAGFGLLVLLLASSLSWLLRLLTYRLWRLLASWFFIGFVTFWLRFISL